MGSQTASLVVYRPDGRRLCHDKQFRSHAPGGTVRWAIKVFHEPRRAIEAARRCTAGALPPVLIPHDYELNAAGQVADHTGWVFSDNPVAPLCDPEHPLRALRQWIFSLGALFYAEKGEPKYCLQLSNKINLLLCEVRGGFGVSIYKASKGFQFSVLTLSAVPLGEFTTEAALTDLINALLPASAQVRFWRAAAPSVPA